MLNSSTGLFFFKFNSKDGMDAMLVNGHWLCYTSDMCMHSWGRSSYARAMIELRADVELKDTIVKNPRQANRGVPVGPMVRFKPIKQVYKPVSNKNNANTNGENKQDEVSRKEVSKSNPFDALKLVENDDDFGTNGRNSKSSGKGDNYGVFLSDHGSYHVASSSISTTHIVERIDKIERQNIDGKLTLVDDDGKPLPKVVFTVNADSDSEVEEVVDEHAIFMASTSLKNGTDSGYGTNSLLKQWTTIKWDDDYDPYDDDLYESHDI
ncbi:hypothetical protein Tco_0706237 [Tanacetum coccineum]|uniref:DUF4283 domain-containing protein n=1 Tax=Tanacetum coccineum TaxID=301880 RepID=A0ABQ4Y8G1_9ASTR